MKTNKWQYVAGIMALIAGMWAGAVWGGEVKTIVDDFPVVDVTADVNDLYLQYSFDESGKLSFICTMTIPESAKWDASYDTLFLEYPRGTVFGFNFGIGNLIGETVYKRPFENETQGYVMYDTVTRLLTVSFRYVDKTNDAGVILNNVSIDPKDLNIFQVDLIHLIKWPEQVTYRIAKETPTTKVKFQSGNKRKKRR